MSINGLRFAFVLVGLLGVAATAHAETQWERTHPRRDEVNDRLAHQDSRINTERREGEISGRQAQALHRDDRNIRTEERNMAAHDGGHITRREDVTLNRQENQVSREIGR